MITKNGDLLVVAVAVAYAATGPTAAFAVAAVVCSCCGSRSGREEFSFIGFSIRFFYILL